MRWAGSAASIFLRRDMAWGWRWAQASESSWMFISLFFLQTSSYLLPSKSGLRVSRMWKITPAEKTSHSGSMCLLSVRAMISGATQPGVPQRKKRYFSRSALVARPQSTMTGSIESALRSIMFSGLRSRCISRCPCSLASPRSSPVMHSLTSSAVKWPFLCWILWKSCPPVSRSSTTQMEFSDSQTAYKWSRLWWRWSASARITASSLMRLSFPFLAWKQLCFEKAFTANLRPSVARSTSQTQAKLPLPSFLRGLNIQWKPSWLSCRDRQKAHASSTAAAAISVTDLCWSKKSLRARLPDRTFFCLESPIPARKAPRISARNTATLRPVAPRTTLSPPTKTGRGLRGSAALAPDFAGCERSFRAGRGGGPLLRAEEGGGA